MSFLFVRKSLVDNHDVAWRDSCVQVDESIVNVV